MLLEVCLELTLIRDQNSKIFNTLAQAGWKETIVSELQNLKNLSLFSKLIDEGNKNKFDLFWKFIPFFCFFYFLIFSQFYA